MPGMDLIIVGLYSIGGTTCSYVQAPHNESPFKLHGEAKRY